MIGIKKGEKIEVFNVLPDSYGKTHNLRKLSPQEVYDLGFRTVYDITLDGTNKRGEVIWNEDKDRFEYESITKSSKDIKNDFIKKDNIIIWKGKSVDGLRDIAVILDYNDNLKTIEI